MNVTKIFSDRKHLGIGTEIFTRRQTDILSAALILMVTVAISRVLGLVRARLLASQFTPDLIDVYIAAFRLPDIIFNLLIFGTLSVAFIPVFTEISQKKGPEQAWKLAAAVINLIMLAFLLLGVVAFVFAPVFSRLIAPGLLPDHFILMTNLSRIMLVGQLLLVISSFFVGINQSFQRFLVPAIASVFYNVGIIAGILFLSGEIGIYGAAVGVVAGAFLHLVIQLPLILSLGFSWSPIFSLKTPGVSKIIRLVLPRSLSLAMEQINELVSVQLASLIAAGSITFLTFAQYLYLAPVGLFGATIAQAALPVLANHRVQDDINQFKKTLLTSFHHILFLVLPLAMVLIILRIPLVRLVFGASPKFDWIATVQTGQAVAAFSIGLAAVAVNQLLIRAFYALQDTKTPVVISIVAVAANVGISVLSVFVWHLPVWGLGMAATAAAIVQTALLLVLLDRSLGTFDRGQLFIPAIKMLTAAVIAAVVLYMPMKFLDQLVFDTTKTINLLLLTSIATFFGLGTYGGLTWLFKVEEIRLFWKIIDRIKSMKLTAPQTPEIASQPGQN
ncbi:murein biosynthesis integral membrane protein MurJ [Candidatus Daviesbacteria bacterium]|nr:murein biosynthesis integral membrane protein MurJ [Candidatus Daviesbacteria bacterium]